MTVIKYPLNIIADPLSKIINTSLRNGIFPDKLTIAKVLPVFKSEDPQYFVNYRPISLLSNFSKVFEKVVSNRFITRLIKILYCCQFGFRKNRYTALSLTYLINKVAESIDGNDVIVVIVFLDLSKAFDTLDHEILFNNLKHYSIRGVALEWVKSYFSERLQFVQFYQTTSCKCQIKRGVPQWLILGPLFFILYINDLPNASNLAESLLFADDNISIFYPHRNQDHIISVLNEELIKIDNWMKSNKLSVNIKTNYVFFQPERKKTS